MGKLGGLLIALSLLALFMIIVIPVLPFMDDNPTIDQLLQPIICQPGETILRDLYSRSTGDGTSFSMEVYCVDVEGRSRDETGRWGLIGAGAYVVPFVIGLFMVISASNAKKTSAAAASFSTLEPEERPSYWVTRPGASGGQTLTQRLRELQEAHEAGLISALEYERTRQKILDSMDD